MARLTQMCNLPVKILRGMGAFSSLQILRMCIMCPLLLQPLLLPLRTCACRIRVCIRFWLSGHNFRHAAVSARRVASTHTCMYSFWLGNAGKAATCELNGSESSHPHTHPSCHLPTGTETLTAIEKSSKTHTPVTKVYAHPADRKSSPKRTLRCDKTATRSNLHIHTCTHHVTCQLGPKHSLP